MEYEIACAISNITITLCDRLNLSCHDIAETIGMKLSDYSEYQYEYHICEEWTDSDGYCRICNKKINSAD